MYPQSHFLFSFFVASIFVKLGFFNYKIALFVALVGVLIDIDHFIVFIFKYNKFSLRDAWNRAVKGLYAGRSFIHHWIGFILIALVVVWLYYFNKNWFWIIGLGYSSHLFLDYAHLNILKIKERMTIKEFGVTEKINKFEVLLDIFLVIGIILLYF